MQPFCPLRPALCGAYVVWSTYDPPTFRIVAGGADITSLINDRLLLLRTTEKPGMESDDFELCINDRDSASQTQNN